jgi:hypothetical protein
MVSKEEAARLAEQGERYLCKPTSIVMLKQYIETFFSDNLYGVGNVSR